MLQRVFIDEPNRVSVDELKRVSLDEHISELERLHSWSECSQLTYRHFLTFPFACLALAHRGSLAL